MRKKMIWGFTTLIILVVTATVWKVMHDRAYIKQLEQDVTEQKQQSPLINKVTVVVPPTEQAAPKGHVHEDGTFHEGEHPEPVEVPPSDVTVSRDYTPVKVQIPEGITDSDVLAAWEHVEYIANNIWDWGGVPVAENEALIAALMPPSNGFSGPDGHSDAEETIELLGALDPNDPRAAPVLVAYFCGGIIGGMGPRDTLVYIGPPAVPLLLSHLFDDNTPHILLGRSVDALGGIAVKYRKEIPGIVDHILIPKFEEFAAIADPPGDMTWARYWAREALERLK